MESNNVSNSRSKNADGVRLDVFRQELVSDEKVKARCCHKKTILECNCSLVRTNVNKLEALLCWSTCLFMILMLTSLSPKVAYLAHKGHS